MNKMLLVNKTIHYMQLYNIIVTPSPWRFTFTVIYLWWIVILFTYYYAHDDSYFMSHTHDGWWTFFIHQPHIMIHFIIHLRTIIQLINYISILIHIYVTYMIHQYGLMIISLIWFWVAYKLNISCVMLLWRRCRCQRIMWTRLYHLRMLINVINNLKCLWIRHAFYISLVQ